MDGGGRLGTGSKLDVVDVLGDLPESPKLRDTCFVMASNRLYIRIDDK
jgi:hypothetical protein